MGWELAIQVTASIVAVVVAAGATAWFSIRSNVRQHVWQKIFESKWETIHQFAKAIDDYSRHVMGMHNAKLTWQESSPVQGFVRLNGLFEFSWPQHRRPGNVAQVMAMFPPVAPTVTRQELEMFLTGYRNLLLQELVAAAERITAGFSQLALIGFDPRVSKNMDLLTVKWSNRIASNQLPYANVDFDSFFIEWKALGRLTKLRLRQDLQYSAKSLRRTLRVRPAWRDEVESTSLPPLE